MDLFDYMREQNQEKESPLASRLRPTTLEEVVGQQHIIGKDKLLYRAIKAYCMAATPAWRASPNVRRVDSPRCANTITTP